MSGEQAIVVEHLGKTFDDITAVDDVSFVVQAGESFGFLGPNGAGKSTTINILCTLLRSTAGRAAVAGFDLSTRPADVRRHIGLVFQDSTLDEYLTAEENLRFHAEVYGVPREIAQTRLKDVLEMVDLWERRCRGRGRGALHARDRDRPLFEDRLTADGSFAWSCPTNHPTHQRQPISSARPCGTMRRTPCTPSRSFTLRSHLRHAGGDGGVSLRRLQISLSLSLDFRAALGLGNVRPLSSFDVQVESKRMRSDEDVQRVESLADERCSAIWAMQNPVAYSTIARKV